MKSILVVDDDEGIQELLSHILKNLGHKVHGALRVRQAQTWLGKNKPDLIFLDLMMPDMSGLDLCRWVKSQEALSGIPIIQISALKDEATKEVSLMSGVEDFITKPFDAETVQEKIRRVFARRGGSV